MELKILFYLICFVFFGCDTGSNDQKIIELVKSKKLVEAKELIKKGASINAKDKDGYTLLMYAINSKNFDFFIFVTKKGAKIHETTSDGWTPLMIAAKGGDNRIIKHLLKKGANINKENPLEKGWTPLLCAIFNGHSDTTKLLLKNGANPNIQDKNGATPLHWAITVYSPEIVQILLKYKANPFLKNKRGKTAFDTAIEYRQNAEISHKQAEELFRKKYAYKLTNARRIVEILSNYKKNHGVSK